MYMHTGDTGIEKWFGGAKLVAKCFMYYNKGNPSGIMFRGIPISKKINLAMLLLRFVDSAL